MKLLNQSLKYLSISILAIVTVWAAIFYIKIIHEIEGNIDEGLDNYKRLIIQNAHTDSSILTKSYFDEIFFTIREIDKQQALSIEDSYIDTVIFMQDPKDKEPESKLVRLLTTNFEINGQYYELKVANSTIEEYTLIDILLWDVVWLYIIIILGIILINNIALKKLWKPFYDFLDQLKNYRLGSTKKLPEVNTQTKEFIDFQQAVISLLKHTIATFEQQKQFIGNASHELQTPLAIATNKLELLLENENLNDRQAENVTEIFVIVQRLVRLNKSLLLLSKIDNKQFFDNQRILVNELVQKTVTELEEFSAFKKVNITVNETGELYVQIDPALANIIVSNLLKNAIFHNIENGKVEVNISKDLLKICNTGKNQMLDEEKIFNRFQTSDSVTSGAGVGLAIVKAIADLYGFHLSYHYNNGEHCFDIQFISK